MGSLCSPLICKKGLIGSWPFTILYIYPLSHISMSFSLKLSAWPYRAIAVYLLWSNPSIPWCSSLTVYYKDTTQNLTPIALTYPFIYWPDHPWPFHCTRWLWSNFKVLPLSLSTAPHSRLLPSHSALYHSISAPPPWCSQKMSSLRFLDPSLL